jgi:hypothetical protein
MNPETRDTKRTRKMILDLAIVLNVQLIIFTMILKFTTFEKKKSGESKVRVRPD